MKPQHPAQIGFFSFYIFVILMKLLDTCCYHTVAFKPVQAGYLTKSNPLIWTSRSYIGGGSIFTTNPNKNKKNTCNYDFLRFKRCRFTAHKWKLSNSFGFMGPSRSDFSLASVLFGLYECVCNNSLKLHHGEISRLCYIAGHYRTTTCITSSVLISQNGCWGAQQEGRWPPQLCYSGCAGLRRLCFSLEAAFFFFCTTLCALASCGLAGMSSGMSGSVHRRAHMCRWGACVHACRMTFREMWQQQKKHLTHNWSAMKEIWSWVWTSPMRSTLNERKELNPQPP